MSARDCPRLHQRWQQQLDTLRTAGRYRSLRPPLGVDLTSNDYLGYGSGARPIAFTPRPELSHSGMASRLLRGQHPIWQEVEAALAAWHGTAAALVFTSGYVANEGLLATVIEPGDWVASDELNHASIIDALRLSKAERCLYRHHDLQHLEEGLQAAARQRAAERELFIVTESLHGMDGDVAPLRELTALAQRYEAHIIVDEAHATGCFGATGSGLVDALGVRAQVLATMHTGGKALGVTGAYIAGSARLCELLVNRCRHFIFTTALPPIIGGWWLDALRHVQADHAGRTLLQQAAQHLRSVLRQHGIAAGGAHYIAPLILGEDERAVRIAAQLQAQGWDVRAIRPPTVPQGTARLRLSIHAEHPPELLEKLGGTLAELLTVAD